MALSHMISIGRDNIVRMTSEQKFYDSNPAFTAIRDRMNECRAAFKESGRRAGCHCRADTKLLVPCLEEFLNILLQAQQDETQYDTVNNFVRYVAQKSDISNVGVHVYFRDGGGGDEMIRHEFRELRKS
jgi:hypothetical protein